MTTDLSPLPTAPPGRYRHYKGGEYEVVGVARHSETLEPLVLYRPLYNDSGLWVRPYDMFFGQVEVGGRLQPRFARVEDQAAAAEAAARFIITTHDDMPAEESRKVDEGLGMANKLAAPLHEVRPLSCFAHLASGEVVGGAVGRTWGGCCELQQLWVEPGHRRKGIATSLVKAFEAHAQTRGCRTFYLETFNFQAPEFYRSLGYEVSHEHAVYPHSIVKYLMVREA